MRMHMQRITRTHAHMHTRTPVACTVHQFVLGFSLWSKEINNRPSATNEVDAALCHKPSWRAGGVARGRPQINGREGGRKADVKQMHLLCVNHAKRISLRAKWAKFCSHTRRASGHMRASVNHISISVFCVLSDI